MRTLRHWRYLFRLTRPGLAWHVLRGRPLAYRVAVRGQFVVTEADTTISRCTIYGDG